MSRRPWVCPDCYLILADSQLPQAKALEILTKHQENCRNARRPPSEHSAKPTRVVEPPKVSLVAHLPVPANAPVSLPVEPNQHEYAVKVERLPFKLLPPGTWDIEQVIAHYRREGGCFSANAVSRKFDQTRLIALQELRPSKCYVGEEMWDGYVVFEFSWSRRVVLDCPITGNAIYIISGDWKELARHSKFHLRREYSENCKRVLHTGNWLRRVKAALQ